MAVNNRSPFVLQNNLGGGALAALLDMRFCAGNVFFVQSTLANSGDTVGRGTTPDAPFASISYAIGKCTADQGDMIIVLPGHVETITAAAGVNVNVAGVTILGIGRGRQRPKVNYTTAAAASFDVTAARCCVENLLFTPTGVASVTAAMNVSAADFTLSNCEFELADATNQAALGILTTASADRTLVDNCFFHGTSNAGTAAAIRLVGGSDIRVRNCSMHGSYTVGKGGIDNITTACNRLLVDCCVIVNNTALSTNAINLHASTTGAVTNCRLGILSGLAPITGAALDAVGGNYYKAAVGAAAGTLI